MLTLLIGTDWKDNQVSILNKIRDKIAHKNKKHILIVPESISHDTERRLCDVVGNTASAYAEVLSFSRLAGRVADLTGHGSYQCMDNGGRVIAMANAAIQLHSKLKAYAALETRPEFLVGLVEAIDEFKRCCISADDLLNASKMSHGGFAQKLEELSLLLDAYDGTCQQGLRDPRDLMTWLLEQLEDCNFAADRMIYVDGFPDFTRQHMAILEHFIVHSEEVTICLTCDEIGSRNPAFETSGETAKHLVRYAQTHGVPYQIQLVEGADDALHNAVTKLFYGDTSLVPELSGRVHLYQCDSLFAECDVVAEKILELIQKGNRYRDITVACADMNAYSFALNLAFMRREIPVYLSGTEDILDMPVINTTLSALDAALCGFERQDVLRYLRSALSPLAQDMCDILENYAVQWNITGNRWNEEWKGHPDGLGKEFDEESLRLLKQLNEARILAISPLFELKRSFHSSKNLKQQTVALYHFLDHIEMATRLEAMARDMDNAGENRSAQILNQLWEILISALEQMHDVIGHTVWGADNYSRLLHLLLSQYDIGTIPPVLDSVTVGPVSALCCQKEKHLFVLGAQEGLLPGYCGSVGVLNDQERTELRRLGVPLTGGALEGLQAEFSQIYGVFCGAEETVSVMCSGDQKSFIYRRLFAMSGAEEKSIQNKIAWNNPYESGALCVRNNWETIANSLSLIDQYAELNKKASHVFGRVCKENIKGLYGDTLNLSASQIDKQAECRLAYFLKYGLRAKERKVFAVDPAEFGTFVHSVLENTGRKVKTMGGFRNVSLDEVLNIASEYANVYSEEHFSQLDSERTSYLLHRNKLELEMIVTELWEELQNSHFEPEGFEVAFGFNQGFDAIPVSGQKMSAQLRGFVDRVDTWNDHGKNYYRVVDYKTGKKDLDYCDIFNGIGLQMFLYLFALEDCGSELVGSNPVPSGVQYFPARAPVIRADSVLSDDEAKGMHIKAWKRKGLLLDDEHVISAMDDTPDMARLCCKRKKDGSLVGDLANGQQLRILKKYLVSLVGKMVDDIASGSVDPNPYTRGVSHNACSFCPYASVCNSDTVNGRRNFAKVSAEEFWEYIGKEVSSNG